MGCAAAGNCHRRANVCRSLIRRLESDYCVGLVGHIRDDLAQTITPFRFAAVMRSVNQWNAGDNDEFEIRNKAEVNQGGDKISGAKRGT